MPLGMPFNLQASWHMSASLASVCSVSSIITISFMPASIWCFCCFCVYFLCFMMLLSMFPSLAFSLFPYPAQVTNSIHVHDLYPALVIVFVFFHFPPYFLPSPSFITSTYISFSYFLCTSESWTLRSSVLLGSVSFLYMFAYPLELWALIVSVSFSQWSF